MVEGGDTASCHALVILVRLRGPLLIPAVFRKKLNLV